MLLYFTFIRILYLFCNLVFVVLETTRKSLGGKNLIPNKIRTELDLKVAF